MFLWYTSELTACLTGREKSGSGICWDTHCVTSAEAESANHSRYIAAGTGLHNDQNLLYWDFGKRVKSPVTLRDW